MPQTIGWVGLGRMGLPMAKRLLQAGYDLRGFDVSQASCAFFEQSGGRVFASPADAAMGADILITMLPDGAAVRSVMVEGVRPAVDAMAAGALAIDMSSSAPSQTLSLGNLLAHHGVALIDAPVSGGVTKAIDGTLAIMAGGDSASIERAAPVLEAMGRTIFVTGALGSGHAMKALNNYVSAAGLIAACEAVRVATAFGLDPNRVVDILNASTGRNNSTENKLKQQVISGRFESGFGLWHLTKDIGIAADLAADLRREAPLAAMVAGLAREALAALGPGSDHTEIDRHRR